MRTLLVLLLLLAPRAARPTPVEVPVAPLLLMDALQAVVPRAGRHPWLYTTGDASTPPLCAVRSGSAPAFVCVVPSTGVATGALLGPRGRVRCILTGTWDGTCLHLVGCAGRPQTACAV